MSILRVRAPSPPMVVSVVALIVALGGTSYAAFTVGAKQIKNGAVTTKKLHNGAVTPAKVASKTITLFKGQTGSPGPRGIQGITGPTGPSNAYYGGGVGQAIATVSVPAGDYALIGQGIFSNSGASSGEGSCKLEANGLGLGFASTWALHVPGNGFGDNEDEGVAHLSAAGTISNSCSAVSAGVNVGNSWILAIHVGAASP